MGLHKLTAGDGYTYLTRQVAAHDSTEKGHSSRGDYYNQKGESPGRWTGSGLAGLGLRPGEQVTTEQMKALFGDGRHPNAVGLEDAVIAAGGTKAAAIKAGALGRTFPIYASSDAFHEWRAPVRASAAWLHPADAVRREWTHARRRHRHGTRDAYRQDDCRCDPRRLANRAAQQARRRAIAYGQWQPFVDPEPVRTHLAGLAQAGIGLSSAAELNGVSRSSLHALLLGKPSTGQPRTRTLRAAIAERIFAVTASNLACVDSSRLPDGTSTRRRLQALVALGWSMTRLAHHLGYHPSSISRVVNGGSVTARTDRRVRAPYERLAWQPVLTRTSGEVASVEAARRYATTRGWPSPAGWNDIDNDPPGSLAHVSDRQIDPVAVSRAVDGESIPLTITERRLVAAELTKRWSPARKIAAQLGTRLPTVNCYRRNQSVQ